MSHAYRLHALGSCIQISQPIGFHATWSYLEGQIGRRWRDPEFLGPALERLEDVRRRHALLDARYRDWRREQKASGRRCPAHGEVTPSTPKRWHGDEQAGALQVLKTWQRRRPDPLLLSHRHGSHVLAAVHQAIDDEPDLHPEDLAQLQSILEWARRQIFVLGWETDRAEYRLAWITQRLLGQLHVLVLGKPKLGTVWNLSDD